MVEMMVALAIILVGFLAILDLQTTGIQGATEGRSLFHGLKLGEHFAESLRTEAISWTRGITLNSNASFPFLQNAPVGSDGASSGWLVATPNGYVGTMGDFSDQTTYCDFGVCDAGVVNELPADRDVRFCIHYRLTWLTSDVFLRADVRVLWIRAGGEREQYTTCETGMADDPSNVSFLNLPASLMYNAFVNG
jgi:hypothetical protein